MALYAPPIGDIGADRLLYRPRDMGDEFLCPLHLGPHHPRHSGAAVALNTRGVALGKAGAQPCLIRRSYFVAGGAELGRPLEAVGSGGGSKRQDQSHQRAQRQPLGATCNGVRGIRAGPL